MKRKKRIITLKFTAEDFPETGGCMFLFSGKCGTNWIGERIGQIEDTARRQVKSGEMEPGIKEFRDRAHVEAFLAHGKELLDS